MSEFAFATPGASPRKAPVQARSQATVDAILTACLQVLEADGEGLTTTRVAAVAGVSVGTLYQYFPNREALLGALLADHLEAAIACVEAEVARLGEAPREVVIEAALRSMLAEKARRVPASHALNRVFRTGGLDDRPIIHAAMLRARRAVAALLGGDDVERRAELAVAAVEGMVRTAIDEDPARLRDPRWVDQVVAFARAAVHV